MSIASNESHGMFSLEPVVLEFSAPTSASPVDMAHILIQTAQEQRRSVAFNHMGAQITVLPNSTVEQALEQINGLPNKLKQ